MSEGKSGSHKIQSLGAGFIPMTMDINIYDEVITVTTKQFYDAAREVAKSEGIFGGISSGAVLYAVKLIAKRKEFKGKNIVVLLPDGGSKYLSTPLYNE